MTQGLQFQKAVKFASKGRIALVGPAGAGKSFTALVLARLLAGPNGKIAAIDTEHGSLSKYAHTPTCGGDGVCLDPSHFDFDVIELEAFNPEIFTATLRQAEMAKYDVFICDSLSHFWTGKDGALEFVDQASARNKDGFSGWKAFRPHERKMVDDMVASSCHVICTMRTKTDYQEVEVNGKKKRVKVGLAPVQREGLEYEFDLVGYMDDENNFIVDKTRCHALTGKVLSKPKPEDLAVFRDWLMGAAKPLASAPAQQQRQQPQTQRQNPQGNQQAAAPTGPWDYDNGELVCAPVAVQERPSRDPQKPDEVFFAVRLNGICEGKDMAFLFDLGLAEAVKGSVGKRTKLKMQKSKSGYLSIVDVYSVNGVEYRDGVPVPDGPQPSLDQDPLEITDDDIPF